MSGASIEAVGAAALLKIKADAWDEGYYRGVRDEAGDIERADNPYRSDAIHTVRNLRCHCGEVVVTHGVGTEMFTRGLCERCDEVRCDAYPGACRQ